MRYGHLKRQRNFIEALKIFCLAVTTEFITGGYPPVNRKKKACTKHGKFLLCEIRKPKIEGKLLGPT